MSGLELLFLDGGATVTGLLGAGAAALGFGQHKRDVRELASTEELPHLRTSLQTAEISARAGHQALTACWRGPLSLFGPGQETAARDRGVPEWAIASAALARALVEESSELGDLADVYHAQLLVAEREGAQGKGLLRTPVEELTSRLESLECRLTAHVRRLIQAREAFDAELPAAVEEPVAKARSEPLDPAAKCEPPQELPIAILRDRGRLGELYGSVLSAGQAYGEPMKRVLARRGETYDGPVEWSPYCLAYMEAASDEPQELSPSAAADA